MNGDIAQIGGSDDHIDLLATQAMTDAAGYSGHEPGGLIDRIGELDQQVDIATSGLIIHPRAK